MSAIRPVTEAEYETWLEAAIPAYAADKVASGAWPQETAFEQARGEHEELLPNGKDTKDNYLYSIMDSAGEQVGFLWFAVKQRPGGPIAYVYNVEVAESRQRQGHAYRAFKSLESEVIRLGLKGIALHVFGHNKVAQSLYAKLGYEPTNINLYKPLGQTGV